MPADRTAELAEAQARLSRLLIAETRDQPAIIEAAETVRQAERRVLAVERGRRPITGPTGPKPGY